MEKKTNSKTWQLVPEQASSQTLASLEGTGRPIPFCCEEKWSLTEALLLECVCVWMCQLEFSPPMKLSCKAMRAAGLGSLNTIQKWAGSTGSFFSPAMANTTLTMDTVKLTQKAGFSVLFHTSALTLKLWLLKKKGTRTSCHVKHDK